MPSEEETEALRHHNKIRDGQSAPKLEWDEQLAQAAIDYAQQLARRDRLEHSGVQQQGENLFSGTGDPSLPEAVQSWLKEVAEYHCESISQDGIPRYGHYTQCVWDRSTRLGMGKARSSSGWTYIVGRYTPQGNIIGEKPYS